MKRPAATTGRRPACDTVTVCPAIVSTAERAAPMLAEAVNLTEPLPVSGAPEVIVIQVASVVAVHAHVDCVVMSTEALLLFDGSDTDAGVTVYVQAGVAA